MIEPKFTEWLHSVDTVILVCWDLGYIWDASLYDDITRDNHGSYLLSGYCQRGCNVMRTRFLSSSWVPDSSKNTYNYPKNYSPRGLIREGFFMDAEHRALIRQEIARRASEDRSTRNRKPPATKFKSG